MSEYESVVIPEDEDHPEVTLYYVPLDELKPFVDNPREHSEFNIESIRRSMERFGWTSPIIARREDKMIIAGHGRLEAAKRANRTHALVRFVDFSENDAKLYSITDNATNDSSSFDPDKLVPLVTELEDLGLDLDDTGLHTEQLADLRNGNSAGDVQEDDFDTTPQAEAVSQTGDLWHLGEHRLICGDCTDKAVVERVMMGEKADLCLTDPPYSVDYENQKRRMDRPTRKEQGDAYNDPIDAFALLDGFISILPSDVLIMTYVYNKNFQELAQSVIDWKLLYECVWVKQHFAYVMGRRYQPQHEPILIFRRKKGDTGIWNVPENASTVFAYDRAMANPDHPTPRPLEMWTKFVEYQSNPQSVVYDPFLGSGTTMIACEQLNRRCRAIEIEPLYIDVAVRRFVKFTEGLADAFVERDGRQIAYNDLFGDDDG